MVLALIATGAPKLTCCQPLADSPREGGLGELGPARRPQPPDVGAGVAGGLVEAQPGDEAGDVGAELGADFGRVGVPVLGRGEVVVPDRAGTGLRDHIDAYLVSRRLDVAAVVGGACLDGGRPSGARRPGVGPVAAPDRRMPGCCRRRPRPRRRRPGPLPSPPPVGGGAADRDRGAAIDLGPIERVGDHCRSAHECRWSAVAATRPACRVPGCTPMSASRLTLACCIRDRRSSRRGRGFRPRPQDHWIVPAPKTRAPLGAR